MVAAERPQTRSRFILSGLALLGLLCLCIVLLNGEQVLFSGLDDASVSSESPTAPLAGAPLPNYLGFDQIYVINLRRRPEKLAFMRRCLETMGANFTVIEAFDAKELGLTSGTAVSKSHAVAMEHALSHGYDEVLIFEDDVDFDFAAAKVIELVKRELPPDWEYLSLFCDNSCGGTDVSHHLYKINPSPHPWLYAVARGLSKTGMRKILDQLLPDLSKPSDVLEGAMIDRKELNAYLMKSPLIIDQ